MTRKEFEAEMIALIEKVDDGLAKEIASKSKWGEALCVQRILPADFRERKPKKGIVLRASLTIDFTHARFSYEEQKD